MTQKIFSSIILSVIVTISLIATPTTCVVITGGAPINITGGQMFKCRLSQASWMEQRSPDNGKTTILSQINSVADNVSPINITIPSTCSLMVFMTGNAVVTISKTNTSNIYAAINNGGTLSIEAIEAKELVLVGKGGGVINLKKCLPIYGEFKFNGAFDITSDASISDSATASSTLRGGVNFTGGPSANNKNAGYGIGGAAGTQMTAGTRNNQPIVPIPLKELSHSWEQYTHDKKLCVTINDLLKEKQFIEANELLSQLSDIYFTFEKDDLRTAIGTHIYKMNQKNDKSLSVESIERAIQTWRLVLNDSSEYATAQKYIVHAAYGLFDTGEITNALSILNTFTPDNPSFKEAQEAYCRLGVTLFKNNKFDDAALFWRKVIPTSGLLYVTAQENLYSLAEQTQEKKYAPAYSLQQLGQLRKTEEEKESTQKDEWWKKKVGY